MDRKPDGAGLMAFAVEIHDLSGDVISTWRHQPDGIVWLGELPSFLPARWVYTYRECSLNNPKDEHR